MGALSLFDALYLAISLSRRADHLLSWLVLYIQIITEVKSSVLKSFKTGTGVIQLLACWEFIAQSNDLPCLTKGIRPPESHYYYTTVG